MLFNLLESTTPPANNGGDWWVWLIILVPFVILLIVNHFSAKKRTEEAEAAKQKRNDIHPGYILVTIGGIVGEVISVDDEEGSFILKTGDEDHPCYLKLDKVAIYSWEDPNAPKEEETSAEEPAENGEEVFEEHAEVPAEDVAEVPADAEEVPAEVVEETDGKDAE